MKILLIGSGGREHALAWKLAQSKLCDKLYIAPGNPGMAALGTLVPIKASDIEGLKKFALEASIGLTVVGPEDPLVAGLADVFRAAGLVVFGPGKAAAALEGSKDFSKTFMLHHAIPTAEAASFSDMDKALAYLENRRFPLVLKADGLAAGKGVVVATELSQARQALKAMMQDKVFGAAGAKVLIEDFLEGEEVSLLCFCDGQRLVPMAAAQDHKRVGEGDSGPNTGGMGAYSPAPVLDEAGLQLVVTRVLERVMAGLEKEGLDYRGCLYVGLMMGPQGPQVVEFNCRFGDPETQVVVPRMDFDLAEVMLACGQGDLGSSAVMKWKSDAAVCVVLASAGYPEKPETGRVIQGLEKSAQVAGALLFHASTQFSPEGAVVSAGGRVLGITALGSDLPQALSRVYEAVGMVQFEGMHFRRDIGARALKNK